jgi:DNA-binding response OmpR family regulator
MKSILIIEDERDLREAIQTRLIADGYLVRTSETSEEGLKLVSEHKPDLILLDIMTHSMHGSVFLQRLRQLPEGQNDSKVIVLTNLDNDISRDKVSVHNIVDYLVKAKISLDEVAKKVSDALA